jgi:hypothetical protein
MTTSGTTSLSLTARDIITFALGKISASPIGQAPAETEIAGVIMELNLMLKEWEFDSPHLWRQTLGEQTLSPATGSYSLVTDNPLRVMECRYRYPTTSVTSEQRDLPMEEMGRDAYMELPVKLSPGSIPTMWYFDPQETSQTLYIWPVPTNPTTDKLVYTYQRRFQIVTNLSDSIDVPQEWLATVGYGLASRLVDDYGLEGASAQRIIARAEELKRKAEAFDREGFVRFMPNYRFRRH